MSSVSSRDYNNGSGSVRPIEEKKSKWKEHAGLITAAVSAVAAVGFVAFAVYRFKVAGPSEYIVRTGVGIRDINISKKAFQWPFQTARKFSVATRTLHVEVDAMSAQRIPFKMPTVWTVGPKLGENGETKDLINFCRYVLKDAKEDEIKDTIEGIIQGEMRVLTAKVDLNHIFQEREVFQKSVVDRVNNIIQPLGLFAHNANIAELKDLDDHNKYFAEQKQRSLQQVNQQARVATAEAVREGEVGEKTHQGATRQKVAEINTEATLVENQKKQEVAESEKSLAVKKAEYERETKIAQAESKTSAEKKTIEYEQEVEKARKQTEIERLMAKDWSSADVAAQVIQRKAQGEATSIQIKADAELYAIQRKAEGELYEEQKRAEAILAVRTAEANGLKRLMESAGDIDGLNKYLLIEKGVLPELADKQAQALQGLKPNVNYWSTGSNQGTMSEVMTDLFKTGMPLLTGIKQQTGYDFLGSAGIKKDKKEEE